MTDPRQSGAGPGAGQSARSEGSARGGDIPHGKDSARGKGLDCADVEQHLADWAENTLPSAVAEQVRLHAAGCPACTEKLAEARRGREWLLILKQEALHPPADLVARILARTSLSNPGLAGMDIAHPVLDFPSRDRRTKEKSPKEIAIPAHAEDQYSPGENTPIPAWQHSSVVVLRRTLLDPRLALVAAMAFFSISLTLNMLGFRLTGLHTADFKPANMHRAVIRQVAYANASVVRYYENLRIVYEMEARVQQLRRAAQTTPPPQQTTRPRKQSFDPAGNSSGNSSNPASSSQDSQDSQDSHGQRLAAGNKHAQPADSPDPAPITAGPRMDAAIHLPGIQASPAGAFLLKVWFGNVNPARRFPNPGSPAHDRGVPGWKERPHIDNLATSQYQEKGSAGWVEIAIENTLATSFVSPFLFQPAPQAAPCSLRNICSSMRYFSTRERRLA